jgi:hypothetical protein
VHHPGRGRLDRLPVAETEFGVEQPHPGAEHDRHDVQLQLVEQIRASTCRTRVPPPATATTSPGTKPLRSHRAER